MKTLQLITAALLLLTSPMAAIAQEKKPFVNLSVDRPDISNLPVTIQPGQYQFETGFQFDRNAYTLGKSIPNIVFRTGIDKNTELRLGTTLGRFDSTSLTYSARVSSGVIAFKRKLVSEKGVQPAIALQPEVNFIRTRNAESGSMTDAVTYDLLMLFNNTLYKTLAVNYNLGWFWYSRDAQRWLLSVALCFQHTDRLGYFLEGYTLRTLDETRNFSYDAGITFLINPRLQADVFAGHSWTPVQAVKYLGAGVAFRLDKGDMRHRTFRDAGLIP